MKNINCINITIKDINCQFMAMHYGKYNDINILLDMHKANDHYISRKNVYGVY